MSDVQFTDIVQTHRNFREIKDNVGNELKVIQNYIKNQTDLLAQSA